MKKENIDTYLLPSEFSNVSIKRVDNMIDHYMDNKMVERYGGHKKLSM